jgi:hypothetical protein
VILPDEEIVHLFAGGNLEELDFLK